MGRTSPPTGTKQVQWRWPTRVSPCPRHRCTDYVGCHCNALILILVDQYHMYQHQHQCTQCILYWQPIRVSPRPRHHRFRLLATYTLYSDTSVFGDFGIAYSNHSLEAKSPFLTILSSGCVLCSLSGLCFLVVAFNP